MSITVTVDAAELAGIDLWFRDLSKADAGANRRALLFAGRKAASAAKKELAARLNVKQKVIGRRLKAFAPARTFLGRGDFVRIWLGLRAAVLPVHDARVAKQFPHRFVATMPSGKRAEFARRPNVLNASPRSRHTSPSPAGRPNPKRHALPIDRVRLRIDKRFAEPIVAKHARASLVFFESEFRRLLELNARRAARRR